MRPQTLNSRYGLSQRSNSRQIVPPLGPLHSTTLPTAPYSPQRTALIVTSASHSDRSAAPSTPPLSSPLPLLSIPLALFSIPHALIMACSPHSSTGGLIRSLSNVRISASNVSPLQLHPDMAVMPEPTSPPSSSQSPPLDTSASSDTRRKGNRWRWQEEDELALVKIVRDEEIWLAAYGTGGKRWVAIASRFALHRQLQKDSPHPDGRSCQQHYEKLLTRQSLLDQSPAVQSGSSEEYGELEQDLSFCAAETRSQQMRTEAQKEAARKRAGADRPDAGASAVAHAQGPHPHVT